MELEASGRPAATGNAAVGLNALEVPLVLENIFSFLGLQDLNACRQVSKLWNIYSKKSWKSSGQVHILCGKGNRKSNATGFVNFVRKRGEEHRRSLYSNFTVHGLGGIPPFWNICGSFIKILGLHCCQFSSIDDFRNVVYRSCPNMQELKLTFVRIKEPVPDVVEPDQWSPPQFGEHGKMTSLTTRLYPGCIAVSWMELLSHFPKLKVLNLEGLLTADPGRGKELFSSLAAVLEQNDTELKLRHRTDPVCNNYSDLEGIPPELVTAAEHPKLHLETLCVYMNGQDTLANLRRILTANAGSLKKLKLYRNSEDREMDLDPSFQLPLDALQEVGLLANGFASLSFLRFVPNLRKLTLSHLWPYLTGSPRILENMNLTEFRGVTFPHCSELILGYPVSSEDLRKLSLLMPNVTKLLMAVLTDADSQLARELWPNVIAQKKATALYYYWT